MMDAYSEVNTLALFDRAMKFMRKPLYPCLVDGNPGTQIYKTTKNFA